MNYIDGEWRESRSGRRFESENPATGESLGSVAQSSAEDAGDAIEAARKAFVGWKTTPAPLRGDFLVRVAKHAQDREDELARALSLEHGKTLQDAHDDVQELIHVALYWAAEGRRQFAQMVPSEKRGKIGFSQREPLGVVTVLSPWNFPLTKPALKIFPAMVLGNTIVWKPATETPLIGQLFQELLHNSGVPDGVVNLVQGHSSEIGDALVDSPDVQLVSFTGETSTGVDIAVRLARRLCRSSLELGAKNALIVSADADLDLALDWALKSAFATNGQRETAASRVIIHDAVWTEFTLRFTERVAALQVGDPLEPATDVGPLISRERLEEVERYVQRLIEHGAQVKCGGTRAVVAARPRGFFYHPTVVEGLSHDAPIVQEEVLGPVTTLFRAQTLEDAIRMANNVSYGLSSAVFSRDLDTAFSAAEQLDSGVRWINAGTVGAEVGLPFGGTKMSGIGTTEWGQGAIDTFSRWCTTYINYSAELRAVFEDTRLW